MLCALALILSFSTPAKAYMDWQSDIEVTVPIYNKDGKRTGTARNRLTIGQNKDATDGYDGLWDTDAFLSGAIMAYFPTSKTNLWRDNKALGPEKIWNMNVVSTETGQKITITFKRIQFPQNAALYLTDLSTGQTINLTAVGKFDYINKGPRTFRIKSVAPVEDGATNQEVVNDTSNGFGSDYFSDKNNRVDGSKDETQVKTYFSPLSSNSTETGDGNTAPLGEDTQVATPYKDDTNPTYTAESIAISPEFESYYKDADKNTTKPVIGDLQKPADITGWIKKDKGLYIEWTDNSKGDHGFILEKQCDTVEEKDWSIVAALWGVKPAYKNTKATYNDYGKCYYRVIAFNETTESPYSDIVTFDKNGDIIAVPEKKDTKTKKEEQPISK